MKTLLALDKPNLHIEITASWRWPDGKKNNTTIFLKFEKMYYFGWQVITIIFFSFGLTVAWRKRSR